MPIREIISKALEVQNSHLLLPPNLDLIENTLTSNLQELHTVGPVDQSIMEELAYIKRYFPQMFAKYENRILYTLGLFYKVLPPKTLKESIYKMQADAINEVYHAELTPIQAHAYGNIKNNKYFSFSAPTSAGKSYLFQRLIEQTEGDTIIVVPSRALIGEYTIKLKQYFKDRKDILILNFVENVNQLHTHKRVYIITPERGTELFRIRNELNPQIFLFDEAQIAEENIRGMKFDTLVRRIDKVFPNARKIFAHPFIENPEAQLAKHHFIHDAKSHTYHQNTVGRIYLTHKNGVFQYFSPFNSERPMPTIETDIVEKTISNGGTLMIYTTKNQIYNEEYLTKFRRYIDLCHPITDPEALHIIEKLKQFIGANNRKTLKQSQMIENMRRGIVIHHGSLPLMARNLIEEFVNKNFAKICFVTSTLLQGINMPIDIVWIDRFSFHENNREQKNLKIKNLIGRAGRTNSKSQTFDYGFLIINKNNINAFRQSMAECTHIKDTSILDASIDNIPEDLRDVAKALQEDSFNDDLQITNEQAARLSVPELDEPIKYILDNFIFHNKPISGIKYNKMSSRVREAIKDSFKTLYSAHISHRALTEGEQSVLSTAISILLWQIQGRSFSQLLSMRYRFITQRDLQNGINKQVRQGHISYEEAIERKKRIKLRHSSVAHTLPNKTIPKYDPLFPRDSILSNFKYDKLVCDTYDYIDKVISQSLAAPLCAAFSQYYERTKDNRAKLIVNYIKYGTNDEKEILLQQYGFSFEDILWIKPLVQNISKDGITFSESVQNLPPDKFEKISRYYFR